jgi:hypothetical protein
MARQTNTARRRGAEQTARGKASAARLSAARRERRRRIVIVTGVSFAVLAIIGAIVAVGASQSPAKPADSSRPAAPAVVTSSVAAVPAATLATVGKGSITAVPKVVSDSPLTGGAKPEVLFIGAEFCPYCAAERWPLVQALSRFGAFTGLKSIRSSPTDVFPNTATFSFYGSTYTSNTIAFSGRELETVTGAQLETPTAAEAALWKKYTGQGSFPFLDIGGKYVVTVPSYDPAVLTGLSATEIAQQLADPTSKVAQAVDGAANVITAAICTTTNGVPAAVCTSPGVTTAAKTLGA